MSGVERRPAVQGVLGLAALLVGFGTAASPSVAAEESTFVLPGTTHSAVSVDLDGDGERELVRVVAEIATDGHRADAWGYDGSGWHSLGSTVLERPAIDTDDTLPLELDRDAVALLPWRVEGRDRLLLLTAGWTRGTPLGETCCLSIAELRLENGGLALHPLAAPASNSTVVERIDVDADGTEELLLLEFVDTGREGFAERLKLLRWDGSAFQLAFDREYAGEHPAVWTGESDGIPGDEVLFGPTVRGSLERIAWVDGEPRSETALLEVGRVFDGWAVGATGGVTVLALSDGIHVLRWPRGEDAVDARHQTSADFPNVFLVGSGAEALIVLFDGWSTRSGDLPAATVYDLALRPLREVHPAVATQQIWTAADRMMSYGAGMDWPAFPYVGPIPGGWTDGRPAIVANGVLIMPDGSGTFEQRPIASLAGIQPIGLVGPGAEWLAMSLGFTSISPEVAYLYPGAFAPPAELSIAPVDSLLAADDEAPAASLTLRDAVETGEPVDGVQPLVAQGAGFEVVVAAAPGSKVLLLDGWRSSDHEVADAPLVVEVRAPRRRADENQPLDVSLLVLSPEGRAFTMRWEGTFVREPPELSVTGSTEAMAPNARLEGMASPGATVTAGDRPVATDSEGRFAIMVDAPLWPSAVRVTARDALGNETTELVEVVGFYDYRTLPWPAFVAVATLVAGVVLFLRVPRVRTEPAAAGLAGDARLEEIELDAVDPDRPAVAP